MPNDKDRARSVTFSLYESQINNLVEYRKKHKRFKYEAALVQHIIDSFFTPNIKREFLVYVGYPIIITALMLYVAISTQALNDILAKEGYLFNELLVQTNIYYVIGFMWLGILMASVYWFFNKMKQR